MSFTFSVSSPSFYLHYSITQNSWQMASSFQIQARLPTKSDFPPSIHLDIITPPKEDPPLNILLILHGLGDTETPFATLGRALNLPYTACISIRAPSPVPALFTGSDAPSFHWGDDILFDQSTGEIDLDAGFTKATAMLWEQVVSGVLFEKCHYQPRDVMILGFGQGGMVALQLAALKPEIEFGGVIPIGGRLPSSSSSTGSKAKTPVLVLGGSRSTQVTRSAVDVLKARFGEVEYVKWVKAGDSMPANREEMVPIMRFFARRLKSRAGVPEGAVELG
jgi:predicted esterase